MLLSKNSLDKLQEDESETKLDRVRLYVSNQKQYIENYTSPSTISSVPSSCADDEDNDAISRAFTASISEILRRKYAAQEQNEKIVEKKKKKKSVIEIDPSKQPVSLPKTKSNGFHLLEKFVSPNLEINRVTLKSNHRKKPKIGLFNKGKSSATGKTVPDLVFSESQFLQKTKSYDNRDKNSEKSSASPPTISRFFKQDENTPPSIAKSPSVASFKKPTSPSVHSLHKQSPTVVSLKKQNPFVQAPSVVSSHIESRKRKHDDIISIPSSETSYTSLIRSFQQQEVPMYSFMKSPKESRHSMFSSYSAPRHPVFSPYSNVYAQEYVPEPHHHVEPTTKDNDSDVFAYYQNQLRDLNWQVDESVAPSQKDDLELIMESPAIHLLRQDIQHQEDEMQNFWLNQSYKRKL